MSEHAINNAKGHAESITAMIQAMNQADETGQPVEYEGKTFEDSEALRERAYEGPLEVSVRSGWHAPGGESEPEEYLILLSTGGPALRIVGDLDRGEPATAELQWQDWGTLWTRHHDTTTEEDTAILEYARLFYFGE